MKSSILTTDESLTQFFYKSLNKVNKKSLCPLPEEFILYSSEVLNKYAFSENFFENVDGKVNEKTLGVHLLEANQKTASERKLIYQDVGDTILVQLGFFPNRIKRKQITESYYLNLGKVAYSNMEKLNCTFYDIPNFYDLFSSSLEGVVKVLSAMANSSHFESFEEYLLHGSDNNHIFHHKIDSKKIS
ncbi:MAG: hypothetical protein QF441_14005 [Bacteriovoracaceae bacterium]|jgi:hypothetical protein|nr:hypothetical protein [Halobacteriovoraceae bacterium]MDP7321721.1 hypothetical protein [Bacteriovoracaceae bacterium]